MGLYGREDQRTELADVLAPNTAWRLVSSTSKYVIQCCDASVLVVGRQPTVDKHLLYFGGDMDMKSLVAGVVVQRPWAVEPTSAINLAFWPTVVAEELVGKLF